MIKRLLWLLLLGSWVLLPAGELLAQQSNNMQPCGDGSVPSNVWDEETHEDPNRYIGVCLQNNLGTITIDGSGTSEWPIDLLVRSCFTYWGPVCGQEMPYTVLVSGDNNGDNFVLRSDAGDTVEIELEYASGGLSSSLEPGVEYPQPSDPGTTGGLFPGAPDGGQVPATITVRLADPGTPPPPGNYFGAFYLSIYQCSSAIDYFWSAPCNGGNRHEEWGGQYAYLSDLAVHVNALGEAEVRISQLQDIQLEASGAAEDIEDGYDFCVHSTGGIPFTLEAGSDNGSGQFTLLGQAAADTINYRLYAGEVPGPEMELQEGVETAALWQGHPSLTCNGGAENNMRLRVLVPQGELGGLLDSTYTDTVTLTVRPE